MKLPKISIVTPSFNQAPFIEEAIQSVLTQGYANLEYVIIDGGSTDSSVDVIRKYESHIHYWISETDQGHGHALNKGFAETSGEIMAWLNSDDKYTPWSLRTVAEVFTKFPEVEWIVGFYGWWNKDGAMTHAARVPKNVYDFLLGNYGWIQQESVFWRRSLWEKVGGKINQDYSYMIDGELWTRFFLHAELYSVDCIFGGYRYHSGNRAADNMETCRSEIEQAISEMKRRCPEDVLRRASILRHLRTINKALFFKSRGFAKMVSNLLPDVSYKNIFFDGDDWAERALPFNLR